MSDADRTDGEAEDDGAPESDGRSGGDQPGGPDAETLREMRERVDELDELVAELRALGDETGVPAVERTARRIEGTLAGLDQHLPPELVDGKAEERSD